MIYYFDFPVDQRSHLLHKKVYILVGSNSSNKTLLNVIEVLPHQGG